MSKLKQLSALIEHLEGTLIEESETVQYLKGVEKKLEGLSDKFMEENHGEELEDAINDALVASEEAEGEIK